MPGAEVSTGGRPVSRKKQRWEYAQNKESPHLKSPRKVLLLYLQQITSVPLLCNLFVNTGLSGSFEKKSQLMLRTLDVEVSNRRKGPRSLNGVS